MRRLRVAALLPALVLAAATVASPFAGTTTARLAADHRSASVHAAPIHAGTGQQPPAKSPATKDVHWKMPAGSIVVLTFAYAAFGGLGALVLMLVARRRGRKVADVIPQPWEFWRGLTKPIRTHGMHRRGSVR